MELKPPMVLSDQHTHDDHNKPNELKAINQIEKNGGRN
jgi:hypothetical protein